MTITLIAVTDHRRPAIRTERKNRFLVIITNPRSRLAHTNSVIVFARFEVYSESGSNDHAQNDQGDNKNNYSSFHRFLFPGCTLLTTDELSVSLSCRPLPVNAGHYMLDWEA